MYFLGMELIKAATKHIKESELLTRYINEYKYKGH